MLSNAKEEKSSPCSRGQVVEEKRILLKAFVPWKERGRAARLGSGLLQTFKEKPTFCGSCASYRVSVVENEIRFEIL